jgi:poly-gamma-glutamate synthesis protein (capsule biosynthesis protein)
VTVDHWDFAGRLRTGELLVHRDVAASVVQVFRRLHETRFPIASMELVDRFGGDDGRSMAANNSSAFNCRPVTGGTSWSEHSYGRAIDLNPVQNPYVRGSTVFPAAGRAFLDRTASRPGLIRQGDAVEQAFVGIGWSWGGRWSSPDYQHFSASGR